jgi:hypothetical protein
LSDLSLLYDKDYAAWTSRTADLLRQGRFADLDIGHLLEELNDMGKTQRHELVNRLRVLLAHLLKWQYQYPRLSARWAEIEGKSGRNTIIEQRAALRYLLEKNPGLQGIVEGAITEAYPQAVDLAADQAELSITTFPPDCRYTRLQILDRGFYPTTE